MPFPSGVSTCTCTLGPFHDATGAAIPIQSAHVSVVLPGAKRLVWAATGDATAAVPGGQLADKDPPTTITFDVAHVDQAGFTDGDGNEVTNWAYRIDYLAQGEGPRTRLANHHFFAPLVGEASLIVNNLPDGSPGTPLVSPVATATAVDLAAEVARAQAAEATKVNSSTYTAGLATKADASALATETTRASNAEAGKVSKAGDIMTGLLTLSGDPTSPLHAATRQYVLAQITALVNGAPGALDTLNELAAELQSDETAAGALTTLVGNLRNLSDSAFSTALSATIATVKAWARNPDQLISGAITRDANGAATSAPVAWPDGSPGTYTADTVSTAFPGAVDAYHITYGSPVTKTYTQPAVTRDAGTGAPTDVPAIVVS